MERTIKFKAWNPRLKMMFTVYSLDFDKGLVFCESEAKDTRHTFGMIDVELLQFTESKDDCEIDIYDGDVVAFFDGELSEIKREDGGRWIIDVIGEELADRSGDVTRVGSIYENPGLLE